MVSWMRQRWGRLLLSAAFVGSCAVAVSADLVRLVGPTPIRNEPRLVVKFDAAFDSVNNVYLVVWGTQNYGPVNGQFVNVNGAPIGGMFSISPGPEHAGWARVTYSVQHQRFLVAYTKILGPASHQRAIRMLTYSGGNPAFLTNEVPVASFGTAGNAAGVAYSPGAGTFAVTWHEWDGPMPRSHVAAVSPAGVVLATHMLTDPNDGQSDPNVACNDTGRCLVVGFSWGVYAGNQNSVWARLIEGAGMAPVGASSFYVDSAPIEGDATVVYSPAAGQFLTAFVRDFRSVWGKLVTADGGLGNVFLMKQSTNEAFDGGGFGLASLSYNPTTSTIMLAMGSWFGLACGQELSAFGAVVGATDCVPGGMGDTHFTVSAADPTSARFLLLDNQAYDQIRATAYNVTGAPVNVAPTIVTQPASQTIATGATALLTVGATGTAPLTYQWYLGASPDTASPIPGANAAAYTTPGLPSTTNYWVRVANAFGFANSTTATITVVAGPPPPPPPPPGSMVRIAGPGDVVQDARLLVKFDAAFDSINQVYLVVWGTQQPGPVNGRFVNVNGAPIGNIFPISLGPEQSGWARVTYSVEQQRFMVAYTKILGPSSHTRMARMIGYLGGSQTYLSNEIPFASFGSAGNAAGVAYSAGADRWFATWHEWDGPMPRSHVAVISPAGAVLGTHLLSNASDGQSDPNIACNGTGRCMVVGFSWGVFAGGQNATWARFIDGPGGTPAGATSFYVDSAPIQGDSIVAYSPPAGKFLVSFARDFRSIWARLVDPLGNMGSTFLIKQTAGDAVDGGGYGLPSFAYNKSSTSFMMAMTNWFGRACAQELNFNGTPVGATDCVPGGLGATQYVLAAADPVNTRFVMFDNQAFLTIRASVYTATPVSQAPVITAHPVSQTVQAGTAVVLSVAATGSAPLTYQWYEGLSPSTASPVGAATSSTYTTPALISTRRYWVRVSNAFGSADSATATVSATHMQNGTFVHGLMFWSQFATPNIGYIVSDVVNGVYEFYRVDPPAGTTNQATLFQELGVPVPADTPLLARFDLGNSSSVRKRISVLLVDSDFSDLSVCTFWLEPNAPLRTYKMRGHTTEAWSNAAIYFYAASAGSHGGAYRLDNVVVEHDPMQSTTRTTCVDPTAPAPPGGAAGPSLIQNGFFDTGVLAPWSAFGSIVTQVPGGVLEFHQPIAQTTGSVLQATSAPMVNKQIMTATFRLGNSSGVRNRITVLLHDADFNDLTACSFWLAPGLPLSPFAVRTYATKAWANATISFYDATAGSDQWIQVDDVVLQRTPGSAAKGTECYEPGSQPEDMPALAAAADTVRLRAGAVPPGAAGLSGLGAGAASGSVRTIAGPGGVIGQEPLDTIDLRGASVASLSFDSRLTSPGSMAAIQVSVDGLTWQTAAQVPPSDDWIPLDVDLTDWVGHVIYVRFAFETGPPQRDVPATWSIAGVRISR